VFLVTAAVLWPDNPPMESVYEPAPEPDPEPEPEAVSEAVSEEAVPVIPEGNEGNAS